MASQKTPKDWKIPKALSDWQLWESKWVVWTDSRKELAEVMSLSHISTPVTIPHGAWGSCTTREGEMVLSRMDSSDPNLNFSHQHLVRLWDIGKYQLYRVMYSPGTPKLISPTERPNKSQLNLEPSLQMICDQQPEEKWLEQFRKHFTATPPSLAVLTKALIRRHLWAAQPIGDDKVNPLYCIRSFPLPKLIQAWLAESDYAIPWEWHNNLQELKCFKQVLQIRGSAFSPQRTTRWVLRPRKRQILRPVSVTSTSTKRGVGEHFACTPPAINQADKIKQRKYAGNIGYIELQLKEILLLLAYICVNHDLLRTGEPAQYQRQLFDACRRIRPADSTELTEHLTYIDGLLPNILTTGMANNVMLRMRNEVIRALTMLQKHELNTKNTNISSNRSVPFSQVRHPGREVDLILQELVLIYDDLACTYQP
jgi:hypothetical protein